MQSDVAALTRPVVRQRTQAIDRRLRALLTIGPDDALARLWTAAIAQAVAAATFSQPDADEEWLRAYVAELSTYLLAGYRAARRRQD